MASREAKLRRLNEFRRELPHVSASALAAILQEIAEHGAPELHSRQDMHRATMAEMEADTPYGPLLMDLELIDKEEQTFSMSCVNPLALLCKAYEQGGSFTELMDRRLLKYPCTPERPWRLILYTDEVVPGNALSFDNLRKLWAIYFSFMEMGMLTLSNEESWFTLFCGRSTRVNRASAGVSQVVAKLLELFFGKLSSNLAVGGMVLRRKDGTLVRFFLQLYMVVQDGGAHKSLWHCKGDAGLRMCMGCRNLTSRSSGLVQEDGQELLICTIIYENQLDFATDEDVLGTVRRLSQFHANVSPQEFGMRETAAGFTHQPHGILLNERLQGVIKPVSQYAHDWMHAIFVNGAWNTVMILYMENFRQCGHKDASSF